MDDHTKLVIEEVRENRIEIKKLIEKMHNDNRLLTERIHNLDKGIFSNKTKLSYFIAVSTLIFTSGWAFIIESLKKHIN